MEIITEALPKINTFFTIDPYTTINEYNQALQALENNNIKYDEYISLIGNYNWFLTLENGQKPIMINYDSMTGNEWKHAVSKVKPLVSNDIYLLYRREGKKDVSKYIENDVFRKARKNKNIIFQVKNREEMVQLSKLFGEIYPLGVYLNGSIRLGICFDPEIKSFLLPDRILLELGPHKQGALEKLINYKILRNQDKIIKYTKTPYWKNGKFYPTSPMSPLKIF
jgi:hypothetical protein